MNTAVFPIDDFRQTKQKVLNWISKFGTFCFLDNNQYQFQPHAEECLVGAGAVRTINIDNSCSFNELQQFIDQKKSWLFGHLSYELNTPLSNRKEDRIQFPDFFFFEPEVRLHIRTNEIQVVAANPESIYREIETVTDNHRRQKQNDFTIQQKIDKHSYIAIIEKLQEHILRGDCYEINFCQEFFAEHASIDPIEIYQQLIQLSPNPFSGIYRVEDKWLLCASPERYLKKSGDRLISQPIKGTSVRNGIDDQQSRSALQQSKKDLAENVMIVDLVRNDLSRVCIEGSVAVDELFGVYTFPQVHQMISSISGTLNATTTFKQIIDATFPMGSMTGAPKLRVQELIKLYEPSSRGIFSGALGYISPNDDFDFNVIIRSIIYNQQQEYLSFQAGSGITFYSNPQDEWEECMLKAAAIRSILQINSAEKLPL